MLVGDDASLYQRRGRSGLDLKDEALIDAWDHLRDEVGDRSDWLIASYNGNQALTLEAVGIGGFDVLKKHFASDRVQYGALRISAEKGGVRGSKLVSFNWIGDDVSGMARARVAMHRSAVDNFFEGTVASLSFAGHEDISDKAYIKKQIAETAQLQEVELSPINSSKSQQAGEGHAATNKKNLYDSSLMVGDFAPCDLLPIGVLDAIQLAINQHVVSSLPESASAVDAESTGRKDRSSSDDKTKTSVKAVEAILGKQCQDVPEAQVRPLRAFYLFIHLGRVSCHSCITIR